MYAYKKDSSIVPCDKSDSPTLFSFRMLWKHDICLLYFYHDVLILIVSLHYAGPRVL
jgi:hypothetical protein